MVEWPVRTLGDLVTLQRGIDLPTSKRSEGEVPIMGSFGITGYHNEAPMPGPGVTVGRSGASIGVVSYIDRDYWPLNTCLYVKDFHDNNRRFAYYLLSTLDLANFNSGSAQPSLNRNFIHPIPLRFPAPHEQDLIVELLGALDDKIELNRRMNETLEAMARTIFKDWFVDFGPTRAKTDGRVPYLAPEIWDLFPDALAYNGLPEGWEEQPFVSFLDVVGGGTPQTKVAEYWGGEIPWFSVVDTPPKGGVFVRSTEKTISEKGLAESSARLIPVGTTVITARGTVGNIAMAARDMTFNQSCYALRAQAPVGDRFVYLATERMVQRLQAMAHGSVFSTITRSTFESLTFPWAGGRLFEEFEQFLEPIFSKINANGEENETLAATRDLLVPRLMSGEIRLAEVTVGVP